jgi:hypothetical protein
MAGNPLAQEIQSITFVAKETAITAPVCIPPNIITNPNWNWLFKKRMFCKVFCEYPEIVFTSHTLTLQK